MKDKEITAEEALKYWYDLATDEQNPPDMVHGMLAAVGKGWLKLSKNAQGEYSFNCTTEGMEQAQALLKTRFGLELQGKLKRVENEKN
jgi:hypothetical protein